MASETRRTARALVETRVERFESRHALAESQARLAAALANARPGGRVVFTPRWSGDDGAAVLEAGFAPAPGVQRLLKFMSIGMTLLVAASVWAFATRDAHAVLAWLLAIFTALAILALPFVFVGLGSQREAEEARILKAIRVALSDED